MELRSPLSPLLQEGGDLPGEVELLEVGGSERSPGAGSPGSLAAHARELGPGGFVRRRRAGVCYLVYCVVCLLLTGALLATTLWEDFAPRRQARFWRRRLRPWEEAGEAFVGTALCTETLALLRVLGWRAFLRSGWRFLDAVVAGLTLLCGFFFLLRRAVHHVEDVVEDVDVPILCLRFALQPIRMVSTASMVVRAHRLREAVRQASNELPAMDDPRSPCAALRSPLPPELAVQIRELLPVHLRFSEWQLLYSPRVHGTSLNTFYRQQAGPNVLVVQDAHGGLFGGFATEPWRPQAGAYGTAEAFVFAARAPDPASASSVSPGGQTADQPASSPAPAGAEVELVPRTASAGSAGGSAGSAGAAGGSSPAAAELRPEVFWAVPQRGRVIQWSDSKMLGLGHAVVVWDNFLRGSSGSCDTFGNTSSLSPDGEEFVVRDFECWGVGSGDD